MTEWKYKLEHHGKILREYINNKQTIENVIAIYNQMIACLERLKEILKKEDKEDWKYDIETMIDDLQCAIPDLEDEELCYEDEEENLNYYLEDFYDLCDGARVWIGI